MNKTLTEEIRRWLIDERSGLIGREALVARADRTIGELDAPPDALIALSLGQPLSHVPRLDLVRDPIEDADCPSLAGRILMAWDAGHIGMEEIETIALRITDLLGSSALSYYGFMSISEDYELARFGIVEYSLDSKELGDRVRFRLEQLAAGPGETAGG